MWVILVFADRSCWKGVLGEKTVRGLCQIRPTSSVLAEHRSSAQSSYPALQIAAVSFGRIAVAKFREVELQSG